MKTLIVWYLVTYGTNGVLGFSPTFPTKEACVQFQTAVYQGYTKGQCFQATIVDQGK